jgi:hypothetical protein
MAGDENFTEFPGIIIICMAARVCFSVQPAIRTSPIKSQVCCQWRPSWRMRPIRGIGAHRTWLPCISVNHLHGITGLEEFDPHLYAGIFLTKKDSHLNNRGTNSLRARRQVSHSWAVPWDSWKTMCLIPRALRASTVSLGLRSSVPVLMNSRFI